MTEPLTEPRYQGQQRGETWMQELPFGESRYARTIVACSQDDCDNDAALIWYAKAGDVPPEREVDCDECEERLDAEAEARRAERVIVQYEEERIKELLLGRSVSVVDHELVLDDGTRLEIATADDCCSQYGVAGLNGCPNLITSVEFEYDYGTYINGRAADETMRVFVLAEDQRINLVEVEGNPGSGHYATGFHFVVTKPGDVPAETDWFEVKR